MKCSKCKAKLKKNMRYCPCCGTKVVRRSRRWISVLLVISLFVGTAFGGWAIGTALAKRVLGSSGRLHNVKINSAEDAIAFSKELGKELGYENALFELTEKITTTVDGDSYYRLQQNYKGIPVYGKNLVYVTDNTGSLYAITGNTEDVVETISLIPSVSFDEIQSSIEEYMLNELSISASEIGMSEPGESDLFIYSDNGDSSLVYSVDVYYNWPLGVGIYELLVDAHSASVISAYSPMFFETKVSGDLKGQSITHKSIVYSKEGDTNQLVDKDRNINTYLVDNHSMFHLLLEAENKKFIFKVADGNDSTSFTKTLVEWSGISKPNKSAVDAYVYAQITYDYFCRQLENVSTDGAGFSKIHLATGMDYVKDENTQYGYTTYAGNAYSYTVPEDHYTLLVFGVGADGHPSLSNDIDVVAHEYMHSVEQYHSHMTYEGESGAIMEGLSDIFGEMVEAWHTNEIDWIHGNRNIKDPNESSNPWFYYGEHWTNPKDIDDDQGGVHNNSTVISHAAYLMWNGINNTSNKKIPCSDLAVLWYRAMLMMPTDCSFNECRQIVEWAASSMKKLTATQRECIGQAFDAVGIYSEDTDEATVNYKLASGSSLVVYDINGEKYLGYHLSISGYTKENGIDIEKLLQGRIGISKGKTYEYETIIDEDPAMLNLPEGNYHVMVSDSDNSGYVYSFTISVNRDNAHERIDLYTEFEKPLIVKLTEPAAEETASPDITGIYAQLPKLFSCITVSESANWELMSSSDGSFDSILKVFDWGDNEAEYPNGTCYIRETSGIFTGLEKINDYSYRMIADRIEKIGKEGDTYIADDLRYIVEDGTGITARDEFYLYLPGTPHSKFPQGLIDSVNNNGFHSMDEITQNTYVLYHPIPESNGYDPVFIGTSNNPSEQAESSIDMASTFGFDKAWDIHDEFETEHMVTSLAFCENGTFYCMVGYYLSDSVVNFKGTYLTKQDEITLQYTLNGAQTVCSYRVDWENRTLTQTPQENLIIPHQIGSKYPFEENTWLTAEGLRDKVEMYPGFLNS